jgi:thiol-disulfide isomerase/thioredoxin
MLSISLGPIALPLGPVLVLGASVLASLVADAVARRRAVAVPAADTPAQPSAGDSLTRSLTPIAAGDAITVAVLLGLMAARLGHLGWHAPAYLESPASMLDIRDGGWNLTAGLVAGLGWLAWQAWRAPALRRPLASGAAAGLLVWGLGLLALQQDRPNGYPAVELARLGDAQPATLAQAARGRPVVVNLWATWCGACRVEMPALAAAQRRHPDIGFLFVNQGESPEKVRAWLARSGLALDEVWLDAGSRLGAAVHSPGLPTTLFLDAQGRQVDAHVGLLSEASLQTRVAALRRANASP